MLIEVNKKEKMVEKKLHEKMLPLIEQLREKEVGVRINTSIGEDIIKKLFILLENDGIFADADNNIIIWDKKAAKKYEEQITSICKRNCSRVEKGTCSGCKEYVATTKRNGFFVKEEIVLAVA